MSVDCIRAGFVDEEKWNENFLGSIDVPAINNGYGVGEVDVTRLCLCIDRFVYM